MSLLNETLGRRSTECMPSEYALQVEARIALYGAPSALKSMAFASPNQYLVTTLSEENRVVLIQSGTTSIIGDIEVGNDPFDLTAGGAGYAYVACRDDRTIDVIDRKRRVARMDLPGIPQGLAWNGAFKRGKRRLMVACEREDQKNGILCVIDEESLQITNTLQIGRHPRGIGLDRHHKLIFVANHGDDSVSIIDQRGLQVLDTVATAGRPSKINYSWADRDHIIVSLDAGGVLQRLDASRQPPELSGLTALRRGDPPRSALVPSCCVPLGQDDLWLAPDRFSESIALIASNDDQFDQIACFNLNETSDETFGLGELAIATPGLPGRIYVANLKRQELVLARIDKHRLK